MKLKFENRNNLKFQNIFSEELDSDEEEEKEMEKEELAIAKEELQVKTFIILYIYVC